MASSGLNAVKLQAENIDLRTRLDEAQLRVEKLQILVQQTSDAHELTEALEGEEDDFFITMRHSAKRSAQTQESHAKRDAARTSVPKADHEQLKNDLNEAMKREKDYRKQLAKQTEELSASRAAVKKATDEKERLERHVADLKEEAQMLQQAMDEMADELDRMDSGGGAKRGGGTLTRDPSEDIPPPPLPPLPPGDSPDAPPLPPPLAAASAEHAGLTGQLKELQEQLAAAKREKTAAVGQLDKCEAEKKIAFRVKEQALKSCGQVQSQLASAQAEVDRLRRGATAVQAAAESALAQEVDELRIAVRDAERAARDAQQRLGRAENDKLEALAQARELQNALDDMQDDSRATHIDTARRDAAQAQRREVAQAVNWFTSIQLTPTFPAVADVAARLISADAAAAGPPKSAALAATALTVGSVTQEDFNSALAACVQRHRRCSAELRLADGNDGKMQEAMVQFLVEAEIRAQRLQACLRAVEATYGPRLAERDEAISNFRSRALAAEAHVNQIRSATQQLQFDLADATAHSASGPGLLGTDVRSPAPDATPGTRTTEQAAGLLTKICELNGLLDSFVPGSNAAPAEMASAGTDAAFFDARDGTPPRPAVSPMAGAMSARATALMQRVRDRQAKRSAQASSSAAMGSGLGRTLSLASSGSAVYAHDEAPDEDAEKEAAEHSVMTEALQRALPAAEKLQHELAAVTAERLVPAPSMADPDVANSPAMRTPLRSSRASESSSAAHGEASHQQREQASQMQLEKIVDVLTEKEATIARLNAAVEAQQRVIAIQASGAGTMVSADAAGDGAPSANAPATAVAPIVARLAAAEQARDAAVKRLKPLQDDLAKLSAELAALQQLRDFEAQRHADEVRSLKQRLNDTMEDAESRAAERDRAIELGQRLEEATKKRRDASEATREKFYEEMLARAQARSNESLDTTREVLAGAMESYNHLMTRVEKQTKERESAPVSRAGTTIIADAAGVAHGSQQPLGVAAAPHALPVEQRLERFFKHHAPEKVPEVPTLVTAFEGQHDVLFDELTRKYGPEPPGPVAAPSATHAAAVYAQPRNPTATVPAGAVAQLQQLATTVAGTNGIPLAAPVPKEVVVAFHRKVLDGAYFIKYPETRSEPKERFFRVAAGTTGGGSSATQPRIEYMTHMQAEQVRGSWSLAQLSAVTTHVSQGRAFVRFLMPLTESGMSTLRRPDANGVTTSLKTEFALVLTFDQSAYEELCIVAPDEETYGCWLHFLRFIVSLRGQQHSPPRASSTAGLASGASPQAASAGLGSISQPTPRVVAAIAHTTAIEPIQGTAVVHADPAWGTGLGAGGSHPDVSPVDYTAVAGAATDPSTLSRLPSGIGLAVDARRLAVDSVTNTDDHEKMIFDLLFDKELKLWHVNNDLKSVRYIVDLKMSDKDEEYAAKMKPVTDKLRSTEERCAAFEQRATEAEQQLARQRMIIQDLERNIQQFRSNAPGANAAYEHMLQQQLADCSSRLDILRHQLKARGIDPTA